MIDYEKGYTDIYENTFEFWIASVRHARIAASMSMRKAKSILEVGSGPDPVFAYYGRKWERYVAIDPIGQYIKAAKQKASKLRLPVELIQSKLEDGALEGPFDYIILSSLLHEVPNPEEILLIAKKLCRDDGRIHVNVPNVNSLHMLLGVKMGILEDVFDGTETVGGIARPTSFDMAKLVAMVTDCGFAVVESGTYLLKPFSNSQMSLVVNADIVAGLSRMALLPQFKDFGCEIFVEAEPT